MNEGNHFIIIVSFLRVADTGFGNTIVINFEKMYTPLDKRAYLEINFIYSQLKHMLWVLQKTFK